MKLHRNTVFNPFWIGVVPLVNVLVLVLAFHTLIANGSLRPGIQVVPPFSSFLLQPQKDPLIATILGGPEPVMVFQDRRCALGEFRARLNEVSAPERAVVIMADRTTPYDVVLGIADQALQLGHPVALATSGTTYAQGR